MITGESNRNLHEHLFNPARALLPEETNEGTKLKHEMLQYGIV